MTSSDPPTPHPLLEKPEPTEYLNDNPQILHSLLTPDQLRPTWIIRFILTQKNFPNYAYQFFHNTLMITQILTTTNQNILTKMHFFLDFHGPHTISNPLFFPLYNNPFNELSQTGLYHLTTALYEK